MFQNPANLLVMLPQVHWSCVSIQHSCPCNMQHADPCNMQVLDRLMMHMHSLLTRILQLTTEVVSEGQPASHLKLSTSWHPLHAHNLLLVVFPSYRTCKEERPVGIVHAFTTHGLLDASMWCHGD